MKRAVILHGTDANPQANWFPWLKHKLEAVGYEVWVPLLPNNHKPNRETYNDFLLTADWDFTDNLVVGHSSGAVAVLNLLMDDRCPHINIGIMVSAWARGVPNNWDDPSQFNYLFPEDGFDFETIKAKARKLAFIHGDADPYCDIEQAQWLAEQTKSALVTVPAGDHLGVNYPEISQLWDVITAST